MWLIVIGTFNPHSYHGDSGRKFIATNQELEIIKGNLKIINQKISLKKLK